MKAHCNTCGGEREHDVLSEHKDRGSEQIDDDFSIEWGTHAWTLRCAGCRTLAFRLDAWNSECYDERGRTLVDTKYFPPRMFRQQPAWMRQALTSGCPDEVRETLKEAYICMQNDCRRAAAMLVRSVLERIMIDKIGDRGTFPKNLEAFQQDGFLAARQRKIIEPILEAGHASIHRSYEPSVEDLILLFDVCETLIEFVYVHDTGVKRLKKRIPRRRRKRPNKSVQPTPGSVTPRAIE